MALDRKKLGISRQVSRACILEFSGAGQVPGPGRIQYTQFFRAQAGSYSEAYTACSKSLDPGRISILKKSEPRSGSWSLAYTVYSNFSGQVRLPIWSVYKKLEKSGPGQDLYTQIFRGQADSCSGAYTESSKSQALGEIRILKFSGSGQVLGPGRIQDTRKNWAPGEISILKFSGPRQVPVLGRIQDTRKNWDPGEICILKFSEPRQIPGR